MQCYRIKLCCIVRLTEVYIEYQAARTDFKGEADSDPGHMMILSKEKEARVPVPHRLLNYNK